MFLKVGAVILTFLVASSIAGSLQPLSPILTIGVYVLCSLPAAALFARQEEQQDEERATKNRREEEEHQARLDVIRNPKP